MNVLKTLMNLNHKMTVKCSKCRTSPRVQKTISLQVSWILTLSSNFCLPCSPPIKLLAHVVMMVRQLLTTAHNSISSHTVCFTHLNNSCSFLPSFLPSLCLIGHTTMLLGAAAILKEMEDSINGTVRIMFQPAEEGGAGAKRMREEGILELEPKPKHAFGLHVWPT